MRMEHWWFTARLRDAARLGASVQVALVDVAAAIFVVAVAVVVAQHI